MKDLSLNHWSWPRSAANESDRLIGVCYWSAFELHSFDGRSRSESRVKAYLSGVAPRGWRSAHTSLALYAMPPLRSWLLGVPAARAGAAAAAGSLFWTEAAQRALSTSRTSRSYGRCARARALVSLPRGNHHRLLRLRVYLHAWAGKALSQELETIMEFS